MPSRPSPRKQLSLELAHQPPPQRLPVPPAAVPALAELLLAALGRSPVGPAAGGANEQQDQR
jgi:hypothetical protein